jgi:hypothetical protein
LRRGYLGRRSFRDAEDGKSGDEKGKKVSIMKKRNLPFLLLSFCFLCIMLGCMATIPVKSATTGLLIDKKEDMPKKVGLYCWTSDSYYIPNYSLKFIIKYPQIGETDYTFKIKLNEELKAGLIRLNFGVLGFQQIEQVLEKSLLDYLKKA